MRQLRLNVERCEDRCLTTLIFVLKGNGFAVAKPNQLTANAAAVLRQTGNQVVQLSNTTINTPAAFYQAVAALPGPIELQLYNFASHTAPAKVVLR